MALDGSLMAVPIESIRSTRPFVSPRPRACFRPGWSAACRSRFLDNSTQPRATAHGF